MEYEIINKVSKLPAFDKTLPVFADIETDGLYGKLRMIQFYQPQTSPIIYIVDIAQSGYNKLEYQSDLIGIEDFIMEHHTVWYNSSYDLGTLNISPSLGVKRPDEITKDTVYNSKVDDLFYIVKTAYPEFQEFGLKKIVKKLRYTKGMYDGINTDDNPKGFVRGAYISKNAYKYAALDVLALSLIWEDKKIQLVRVDNMAYRVDMLSQAYALVYQQNGLVLNRDMWEKELVMANEDFAKYTDLLPAGFNPNSFKQVRAYLNIEKSDAEALIIFALSDDPLADKADYIIRLKRAKKQLSYLKSIEFDRMFTKFNVAGAITGRFTSAGGDLHDHFNAQQIPRNYQYMFNQATDDTVVIDADYSTLELRLAATIFNEPEMYRQFKAGRDLHTEMAAMTSGKKVHQDGPIQAKDHVDEIGYGEFVTTSDRSKAKGLNFGYVFGMSAKTFVGYAFTSYGVKYSLDQSTKLRNMYFTKYPNIAKFHSHIWGNYKKPGFVVRTALGRAVKPRLGTDGINTPVQGSGAETTKLAVHYLVKDYGPEVLKYIYNCVHDAIYLRVPKGIELEWAMALEVSMLKGWTEISKCSLFHFDDIPMIAEVEVNRMDGHFILQGDKIV